MKTLRRELWLLLAPVLLLVCAGFALRSRARATLQVGRDPFFFTYKATRFGTLTDREVSQGYDTKVLVDLKSTGEVPNGLAAMSSRFMRSVELVSERGRVPARDKSGVPIKSEFGNDGTWVQPGRIGHTVSYLLALKDLPPGDEVRLQDVVEFLGSAGASAKGKFMIPQCPPVSIDIVVRSRGQKTASSQTSRDPGFKLERYVIKEVPAPPLDQLPPQSFELKLKPELPVYQVTFFVQSTNPEIRDPKQQLYVESHIQLTDAKTTVFKPLTTRPYKIGTQPQSSFSTLPFNMMLWRPIDNPGFIVGELYIEDKWPLRIRIPFTDKNGKVLLTSR